MPTLKNVQSSQREGKIILTLVAFNSSQMPNLRATLAYNVPYSSSHTRHARTTLRRDCEPNRKKLLKSEEITII